MACQVPDLKTLTDTQSFISVSQLAQSAAADIAYQLGIALVVGETIVPLAPFIWAALAIEEIVGLFGGGRPKDEDTNNVIWAYHKSAYWPLQALGTDLAIALKNGAPISDSRPAIQAQFSAWKRGTITSIQTLAGQTPGPTGAGYWQLQELINTSWVYSKGGQQSVLHVVRAIDCFTEVLTQLAKEGIGIKPPPPPPPLPDNCDSLNPDQDEISDLCHNMSFQLSEIYDQIINGFTVLANKGDAKCCAAVTSAILSVANQLIVIAGALASPPTPPTPIDLSAIIKSLQDLVSAVAAYPPVFQACCSAVTTQLSAIATALGPDLSVNLKPIVDQLAEANTLQDVPQNLIDLAIKVGALSPEAGQLVSGAATVKFHAASTITWWEWITGPTSPGLPATIGRNARHLANKEKLEKLPINSASDVLVAILGFIGLWIGEAVVDVVKAASLIGSDLATVVGQVAQGVDPTFSTDLPAGIGAPAVWALKYVQSAPKPKEVVTTDNYKSIVQDAMGRAGSIGMLAYAAAMTGGLLLGPWEKSWGEVAAMLATAAGFEAISERWLEPFLDAVIAHRARQDANQNWPTLVPPGAQALTMWSRRKLADADRDTLLGYAGLDPTFRPPMIEAAYRPISPRAIATAIADTPFPKDELQDILEDNGYSPAHVAFLLQVFEYNSTKNVRNSYISEAIAAYKAGVMPDAELDDILSSVGWSDQAKQFVRSRALLQRRVTLAAEAEKFIVPEVVAGNLTPGQGLQQLEAAGVEPWYAQLQMTLAETKADIRKTLLAEAEARRQERLRESDLTRAAVAEFQRGVLDDAGLAAALALIPLPPTRVASIVAVQDATRRGKQRWLFGQMLSPEDARLLEERVAAIGQQTKDQLITLDQARAQLDALKVDSLDAQALIARWAAALKKSAGAAQLVTP